MADAEEKILEYLRRNGKSCVKDIADGINLSSATTSKYLFALLKQKKVRRQVKLPFHYYEVVQ